MSEQLIATMVTIKENGESKTKKQNIRVHSTIS